MSEASSGYSAARRLRTGTRDDVRAALVAERERTLSIAAVYRDALGGALVVPYDPGLNPPGWELGHLAWFQEWWVARNRQRQRGVRCDPAHERAPSCLARSDAWYDSGRVEHRSRWTLPLPPLDATLQWMAHTFQQTLDLLDRLPADAGDDDLYFYRLVCLHEAMHAEAACYMARTLGFSVPLAGHRPEPAVAADTVLQIPAQRFQLGHAGAGFAFDNELLGHEVELEPFVIDAAPVTWTRFTGFVDAGGYRDRRWWTPEGWAWTRKERHAEPRFPQGDAPAVHLSCHEAQAWCNWAGRRLPTEVEWECAAFTAPGLVWGQVWEWTATEFEPYAGFEPHPYRDYSQPWFGSRRVLRGACEATSPALAHPRYRNFFEPHRSDVYSGFRSCAVATKSVAF